MSRDENQRAIKVSKAVRVPLVELRLLEQAATPTVLDRSAIQAVESALDLRLGEDLLAVFAAGCDAMRELGMTLERIPVHAAEARAAGCPPELVAIGRAEGPIYLCVSRRDADVLIHEFDPEDKRIKRRALGDWLADLVEQRKADLGTPDADDDEADPEVADVEVGKTDLESFRPMVVAPPPPTGRQVRHATFGVGDVLRELGAGSSRKLEVRFASGTKVLIARVLEDV